jgi:hypothetical protein
MGTFGATSKSSNARVQIVNGLLLNKRFLAAEVRVIPSSMRSA